MKKIKILKDIKASPSLGVVFDYKQNEELQIDGIRVTQHIYNWFLNNKLAVEIAKEEVKKKEKSFDEELENKAVEKSPKNKAFIKKKTKK